MYNTSYQPLSIQGRIFTTNFDSPFKHHLKKNRGEHKDKHVPEIVNTPKVLHAN